MKYVFYPRSHKSLPLWKLCLGYTLEVSPKIGPILQRSKNFEKLGSIFDTKLIQNSEIRVFKSAIPKKVFHCGYYSLGYNTLGPPKRINSNTGPISHRCYEKLDIVFDMKLFQNSEIRVFKSGIPQKSSTRDILSWIHSLGPLKRISSNIRPILQRCKNFKKNRYCFRHETHSNQWNTCFQIRHPTKVSHCG